MLTSDTYDLRHHAQRTADNADQAEFFALINGSSILDAGIHDERIADAMDDFSVPGTNIVPPWQQDDLKLDSAVGQIREEVERRIQLLGQRYPFSMEGSSLRHEPGEHLLYEFCLAICNAPTLTTGRLKRLPRVFERVSARLVAGHFGARSQFLHTGFPRDFAVGRSFKKAMQKLAARTSEWNWGPDPELPDAPVRGDEGCDFVAWPEYSDKRSIGQLFILGQCACGNDWTSKFRDLAFERLSKWFNPPWLVTPVRCFTTPFHITDTMLIDATRQAGIVFDRARLVCTDHDTSHILIEPEMRKAMHELIKLVQSA